MVCGHLVVVGVCAAFAAWVADVPLPHASANIPPPGARTLPTTLRFAVAETLRGRDARWRFFVGSPYFEAAPLDPSRNYRGPVPRRVVTAC